MYTRRFVPGCIVLLEEYERFASETGFTHERLHRAWDQWMEHKLSPSSKRQAPPPKYERPNMDRVVWEKIQKLRRKANDRAVTPEESLAFHAAADRFEDRYRRR